MSIPPDIAQLAAAQLNTGVAIAEVETILVDLRTTLAGLEASKPVRKDYASADAFRLARLMHRTGTRDFRRVIRAGEEQLAHYRNLLGSLGEVPKSVLN